jgi:hypothetical protein
MTGEWTHIVMKTTTTKPTSSPPPSPPSPVSEEEEPDAMSLTPTEDPKMMRISREQYNALMQTNQAAMYLTLNTIEKFDYILDELADFEKKVRDMKKQAKEELKLATTPSQPHHQEPPSQQPPSSSS